MSDKLHTLASLLDPMNHDPLQSTSLRGLLRTPPPTQDALSTALSALTKQQQHGLGSLGTFFASTNQLPPPPRSTLAGLLATAMRAPRPGSEEFIQAVWEKATIVPGYDKNILRRDVDGNWICRSDHGNQESGYGWHADHILPESLGGSDELHNRQPRQWRSNIAKSNNFIG